MGPPGISISGGGASNNGGHRPPVPRPNLPPGVSINRPNGGNEGNRPPVPRPNLSPGVSINKPNGGPRPGAPRHSNPPPVRMMNASRPPMNQQKYPVVSPQLTPAETSKKNLPE